MPKRVTKRAKPAAESATPAPPRPRHQFVPPHELLTAEESLSVLDKLGTPIERLPKIRADDPGLLTDPNYRAAKEGGQDVGGRLVRIRRHSQTAGDIEVFRVVSASGGE